MPPAAAVLILLALRYAQEGRQKREQDAEHGPHSDEDVERGDARLRDPESVGGGEDQGDERPRRRQAEAARQRVDAGQHHEAGDDGGETPAEGAITEQHDAGGDGELAHLRVRPRYLVTRLPAQGRFGADAAVHDGLGVLGVVHLVEHVVGGRGQLPQAQRRGDQQDQRDPERHAAPADRIDYGDRWFQHRAAGLLRASFGWRSL
jgi:hypothetical protein